MFGAHSLLANQDPTAKQEEAAEVHEFADIQHLIDTVYKSISFDKGGEPNWELLESTMMAGATFSQPPRRPAKRQIIGTEAFIASFKEDLDLYKMRETGFWERIINTETTVFGNTAVAFVVFEVRVEEDVNKPMGRGVDSISMVRSEGRWWVTSILTDWERPGQEIPAHLLD